MVVVVTATAMMIRHPGGLTCLDDYPGTLREDCTQGAEPRSEKWNTYTGYRCTCYVSTIMSFLL